MMRRGLTLLEVLIATAILAVLASVAAPMIARAVTTLSRTPTPGELEVADLASIADAFTDTPKLFGYKD